MHRYMFGSYFFIVIIVCSIPVFNLHSTISSLAKNDPYPFFSALDPHWFILNKEKMEYKDANFAELLNDRITIAISPFSQTAHRGRNIAGQSTLGIDSQGIVHNIELSDLEGRPDMLTLLYGDLPQGATLPPTLQAARNQIFPGVVGTIDDQTLIDPNELFASFTFPQRYTKRGVRFDASAHLGAGFGVALQTGYVSLTQTRLSTINLNCVATSSCGFILNPPSNPNIQSLVNQYLMDELPDIMEEINYSLCNYVKHGWEELRMSIFWRHAYELNAEHYNWPHMLAIPFFAVTGSIQPTRGLDEHKETPLFGSPLGNNKHNAVGFWTGINFDFIETVEIGIEGGITHFFKRDIDHMHIPNNEFQKAIFPFQTNVSLQPGMNWHFGAKIAAYHFLERLSIHFQYVIVEHKEDSICLKKQDPAFMPEILECRSKWRVHVANSGFTYDFTPNAGLGFEWQAPIYQRNTFRSSTVLFSIYGTF